MPNRFASGATTQTLIVKESAWGTTPADGAARIPFTENTLEDNREIVGSEAMFGDRMTRYSIHGNVAISGTVSGELAHGTYDLLLESAVMDKFGAGKTIKVKAEPTVTSFTIERGDVSQNIYEQFKGCVVNTLDVEVSLGKLVAVKFGVVGKSSAVSTNSMDNTPTPVNDNQPMYQAQGSVAIAGVQAGLCTDIKFTFSNNITPTMALGDNEAKDLPSSNVTVTGQVTLLLNNLTPINLFKNGSSSAITVVAKDDANKTITFKIPKAKFNSAPNPVSSNDTRKITLDFEGLRDPASGTVFEVSVS